MVRSTRRHVLAIVIALAAAVQLAAQTPDQYRKTNPQLLATMAEVVSKPNTFTVRVKCNDKDAALGTIVRPDGWIVTKYSELKGDPYCILKDGRRLEAELVGVEKQYDLALLRVNATDLPVAEWRPSSDDEVGSFVVTPNQNKEPAAVGVVSVAKRNAFWHPNPKSGYMGVGMETIKQSVRVSSVQPSSPADGAGLKVDDIILGVNDTDVTDNQEVMNMLAITKPGDPITLRISRDGQKMALKFVLGKRPALGPGGFNRGEFQNNMGSLLSDRKSNFPIILQHDSVLRPADCGGPLVDLDGKVIGVNIARGGRTESFAVPSEIVQTLLPDLIAGKLPPPPPTQAVAAEKKPSPAELKLKAAEEARAKAAADKAAADKQLSDAEEAVKKAKAELDAERKAAEKKQDEKK